MQIIQGPKLAWPNRKVYFTFGSLISTCNSSQTNHFIWLDGSQWQYEDWLAGEPNPTSGLEHCVEVLPWGESRSFYVTITLSKIWNAEQHPPWFLICRLLWLAGNGKFNDFTCWTPQAFICSYPYHWTCTPAHLQPPAPTDTLLRSVCFTSRVVNLENQRSRRSYWPRARTQNFNNQVFQFCKSASFPPFF